MSSPTELNLRLQQAADYIKGGDRAAAYAILHEIVPQMTGDWRAWWSLAHATSNAEERIAALRRVLKLKPDHAKAAEMLRKLESPAVPSAPAAGGIQPLKSAAPPPAPAGGVQSLPSTAAPQQPSGGIQPLRSAPPPVQSAPSPFAMTPPWEDGSDPFPEAGEAASEGVPWNGGGSLSPFGEEEPWAQDNPFDAAAARTGGFDPWGGGGSATPPGFGSQSASSLSVSVSPSSTPDWVSAIGAPSSAAKKPTGSGTSDTQKFLLIVIGVSVAILVIAAIVMVINGLSGGGSVFGTGAPNNYTGGDPYRTTGGGTITIGGPAGAGTIYGINDAHNWTFEGRANQRVVFTVEAVGETDPRFRLLDPSGYTLTGDDDSGPGWSSYLEYTLPYDGTYTIRIDVFHVGAYRVSVR